MARFRPMRTRACVTNIDRNGTDYANSYVRSAVSPPEGVSAQLPVKRTIHFVYSCTADSRQCRLLALLSHVSKGIYAKMFIKLSKFTFSQTCTLKVKYAFNRELSCFHFSDMLAVDLLICSLKSPKQYCMSGKINKQLNYINYSYTYVRIIVHNCRIGLHDTCSTKQL